MTTCAFTRGIRLYIPQVQRVCSEWKGLFCFFIFFSCNISHVRVQKTPQPIQNQLQSSRRSPLRWRKPLQVHHPAAETPQGASPASFWVKCHTALPSLPPLISELIFFFFKSQKEKICSSSVCSAGILFVLHAPKCFVLIRLFWQLFCTFLFYCLTFTEALYVLFLWFEVSLCSCNQICQEGHKVHISHDSMSKISLNSSAPAQAAAKLTVR